MSRGSEPPGWVELHSPRDEGELAMLESLLAGEGVAYVVRNDRFGALYPGPAVDLYNTRQILVRRDQYEQAGELIADYLGVVTADRREGVRWSLLDRLRMLAEGALFGWVVPGRTRRGPRPPDDDP